MEGCHLLAIFLRHFFHDFFKGGIIDIHIGNKDKAGQIVFVTQFPRFFCANLNAVLTGYYDNGCICCGNRFLHFAYEIKASGSIQQIDLRSFPFQRNDRGADRNLSLLLFFSEITDGIFIGYFSHAGCNPRQVSHSFHQRCLSGATMSQQANVANFVCCVNIHNAFLRFIKI